MNYPATLEQAITSGGDERIELKSNGLNKYFVNPVNATGSFVRGSCTCSPLSETVRPIVSATFKKLTSGEVSVEDVRIKQRFRIKALLQDSLTNDFNIFFAPSGSDLCFYPLLFSSIVHPDKPIMSLITCPEELGTGSILANRGLYFSDKTQLADRVVKGDPINPDLKVDHMLFPARAHDGSIMDHKKEIYDRIAQYGESHHVIVNLVIGSKSGIEDNISIIEDGPQNVTWVVDLCQMRATPKLFNDLLRLNCLLMITGSKFYQSPPFCGALLVPETYARGIHAAELKAETIKGFTTVYSRYDIPPSYRALRSHFEPLENFGLTLRWEAAISESEQLAKYTEREVTYTISFWNKHIREYLKSKDCFELMVDQDKTNKSIVSFLIRGKNGFLSGTQLKELYQDLLLNSNKYQDRYQWMSTGQPVEYESHSFLRLALGSYNIRSLIESDYDLSSDYLLIDIVERIAKRIDESNAE